MKPSEMQVGKWYQVRVYVSVDLVIWSPAYTPVSEEGSGSVRGMRCAHGDTRVVFARVVFKDDDTIRECCEHAHGLHESCAACGRMSGEAKACAQAVRELSYGADGLVVAGRSVDAWLDLDIVLRENCIETAEQLRERLARVKPNALLVEMISAERDQLRERVKELEAWQAEAIINLGLMRGPAGMPEPMRRLRELDMARPGYDGTRIDWGGEGTAKMPPEPPGNVSTLEHRSTPKPRRGPVVRVDHGYDD